MTLEKLSPCKVNLVLNILGKRADGFHELETLMHPVRLFERLNAIETVDDIRTLLPLLAVRGAEAQRIDAVAAPAAPRAPM